MLLPNHRDATVFGELTFFLMRRHALADPDAAHDNQPSISPPSC
jgi:hypothetical protein